MLWDKLRRALRKPLDACLISRRNSRVKRSKAALLALLSACAVPCAAELPADAVGSVSLSAPLDTSRTNETPAWNWHVQNTIALQYHPKFPAEYSGPNS